MIDTAIQIIGLIGAALLVYGFYQVSLGKLQPSGKNFQIINFVGAALLLVNSVHSTAYGPAVLNFFWLCIALVQLWRLRKAAQPE